MNPLQTNTVLKTTLVIENPTGIDNREINLSVGNAPRFRSGDTLNLETGPDAWRGYWKVEQTSWVLNSDRGWVQEVIVEKR